MGRDWSLEQIHSRVNVSLASTSDPVGFQHAYLLDSCRGYLSVCGDHSANLAGRCAWDPTPRTLQRTWNCRDFPFGRFSLVHNLGIGGADDDDLGVNNAQIVDETEASKCESPTIPSALESPGCRIPSTHASKVGRLITTD